MTIEPLNLLIIKFSLKSSLMILSIVQAVVIVLFLDAVMIRMTMKMLVMKLVLILSRLLMTSLEELLL